MNAELAVKIAQDVLEQLDAQQYIATKGIYIDANELPVNIDVNVKLGDFARVLPPCRACALGSAFLSYAGLGANGCIEDFFYVGLDWATVNLKQLQEALEDVFGEPELQLIESAFEQCDMTYGSTPGVSEAVAFGQRFDDDEERLRAIMNNVITNKGVFTVDL